MSKSFPMFKRACRYLTKTRVCQIQSMQAFTAYIKDSDIQRLLGMKRALHNDTLDAASVPLKKVDQILPGQGSVIVMTNQLTIVGHCEGGDGDNFHGRCNCRAAKKDSECTGTVCKNLC